MSSALKIQTSKVFTDDEIGDAVVAFVQGMCNQPKVNPRSCDWEMMEQDDHPFHYCTKCMRVVPFGEYLEVDEDCPSEHSLDA